jgi:hypothetical protein
VAERLNAPVADRKLTNARAMMSASPNLAALAKSCEITRKRANARRARPVR